MAVTKFDGQFSFKQDSLARLGNREKKGMTEEQKQQFADSPFMQGVKKIDELAWMWTGERDMRRAETDPTFNPKDDDFTAPKAFEYKKGVNYYKVLGIDEYATYEEVKKAYKKLSLVYHPDKTAGMDEIKKEEYQNIFIQVKNAYLTLGDNPTRRQYDRDRDVDKAGQETNGWRPRQEAHFDASEILKNLQEMAKPEGKTINVNIQCRLEKYFYGGHKAVKRERMGKVNHQFQKMMQTYRIDIKRGAEEGLEAYFRQKGDAHAETRNDNMNFKITSKPHIIVERRQEDLYVKKKVQLNMHAYNDALLRADCPSVRGRHVLLWGRNPFRGVASSGNAELSVKMAGEGMTSEGFLRFSCLIGQPKRAIIETMGKSPAKKDEVAEAAEDENKFVVVCCYNMSTESKIWLRVPANATVKDVRKQMTDILNLGTKPVRILKQVAGGYSPIADSMAIGCTTSFNVAGTPWTTPPFQQEHAAKFLHAIIKVCEKGDWQVPFEEAQETFKTSPSEAQQAFKELWDRMTEEICPQFGFEPKPEVMQEILEKAKKLIQKHRDEKLLIDKLKRYSTLERSEDDKAGGAADNQGHTAFAMEKLPSLKQFLIRHQMGPAQGITEPGSDTEDENASKEPEEPSRISKSGAKHGEGGAVNHPTILKRERRRYMQDLYCDLWLYPVGDPIVLFTKPSCTVQLFGMRDPVQESMATNAGSNPKFMVKQEGLSHNEVTPREMFGLLVHSPTCQRGAAQSEWELLKKRLFPILEMTVMNWFRPCRTLFPKSIGRTSWFVKDCYRVDEDDTGEPADESSVFAQFPDVEVRERLLKTRGDFERRQAALEKLTSSIALPWKTMGDEAFSAGSYFLALSYYDKCLADESNQDNKELKAAAHSNKAACFAKVKQYEASLEEAQMALEHRPTWGKAFARVGYASMSLGKELEQQTVDNYFKAVQFDPSVANVNSLFVVAKGAKTKLLGETQPAEKAHFEKEHGNGALRTHEYGLAVAHYTMSLAMLNDAPVQKEGEAKKEDEDKFLRSVVYCNRAGAFCRLKNWALAVADGHGAVAAWGEFHKARTVLGTALLGHGLYEEAYYEFAKVLKMTKNQHVPAQKGLQACLSLIPLWRSVPARRRLYNRMRLDLARPKSSTKVYAVGDMFFDHKRNEDWAHDIDDIKFQDDVLICAGNVCDTKNAFARAMVTLKSKFRRVFWVPGNHEMWLSPQEALKYPDSFAKLFGCLEICDELGVDVFPAAIAEDVFIVPLFSWYDPEFGADEGLVMGNASGWGGMGAPEEDPDPDKHCKWPMDAYTQVWRYMLKLNEAHLKLPLHGTIITFSHFVPNQDLPISRTGVRGGMKAMGCEELDEQVRQVRSRIHVYGHSKRRGCQNMGSGATYVNWYHGLPDEHEENPPIFCIWDDKGPQRKEVDCVLAV